LQSASQGFLNDVLSQADVLETEYARQNGHHFARLVPK
jgi:hypothetical protein